MPLQIADGFNWVFACAGTTGNYARYGIRVVIFLKVKADKKGPSDLGTAFMKQPPDPLNP